MPTADPAHPISYSTALQQSNAKEGDASPTGISPTQNDKQVIHGIEVSQQMIYHGWEPGREYTKNIVLKSVAVKTQKLKFRLVKKPDWNFMFWVFPVLRCSRENVCQHCREF